MTDMKPIKEIRPLYGCDFSDAECSRTLADADWLTRKLTIIYRDRIMAKILRLFHKASSFAITLYTRTDETTKEVCSAKLALTGLWMGDSAISGDAENVALEALKEILKLDILHAETPESIRTIMQAIARDIPGIRDYYDF